MDYHRIVRYIVVLCVGFALGGICFWRSPIPSIHTAHIDTIYRDKPVPYKVEVAKFIEVPKMYFAVFNDTVEIPIEKVVYKEKEFEATISGPSIGNIKPTLDNITIHKQTRLFTPYASVMLGRNVFSLGGGITIKEKHGIGIEYLNLGGKSAIGYKYTYNF